MFCVQRMKIKIFVIMWTSYLDERLKSLHSKLCRMEEYDLKRDIIV